MKKVEFFSDTDLAQLREKINNWLAENKLVQIIKTDLCVSSSSEDMLVPAYVFYIFYSEANEEARAMEQAMEQSIPAVAPDLLKPLNES